MMTNYLLSLYKKNKRTWIKISIFERYVEIKYKYRKMLSTKQRKKKIKVTIY